MSRPDVFAARSGHFVALQLYPLPDREGDIVAGIDATAALEGALALGLTLPGLESGQIGAPEALSTRTSLWVMLGDPGEIGPRQTQVYEFHLNILYFLGYVVEGAESAAEAQLGDMLSELVRRIIQNRIGTVDGVTANLNGSVSRMFLPQAAAGVSEYATYAGAEVRVYPVAFRIVQTETIS